MSETKIQRAIILAAGTGSRLVANESYPKPLKPVAGVPLLVRVLRTLEGEGIREAVIIIGYRGHLIREALKNEPSLSLKLHFVENDRYDRKNGVSLLAAKKFIDQPCILSMADHLYSPQIVRLLQQFDTPEGSSVLAVDFNIERCFDLDDATKVRLRGDKIADIGKTIAEFDCLDTGVFRIGPELVRELERLEAAAGDCSLSDGVRALAECGRFYACDVGDARWIDVDTPEAFARAEAMVRVFGDALGDEPALSTAIDPEGLELFAPTWVRAAQPYKEDHFELAAQRADLVRMMSNESPFSPSERVIQAIVEAARTGNRYPSGAKELRHKLAGREGLNDDNVILGAGSAELIDLIVRTLVSPGEETLISVPTFSMYEARTRVVGGIPVLVPLTDDHELDVNGLITAVTERTKVIFLCSPNNPTGNRLNENAIRRILRLGIPTVIDEAYYELGTPPRSLVHLLSEYPNAIFLRTFSKAFGLAGIRLGYAIAHPSVVRLLLRVKLPWNVSSLSIAAAMAALEEEQEFNRRMQELRDGRSYLVRELSRIPGLQVFDSEGNFVLIDAAATGISAEAIVDGMLRKGLLIRLLATHHARRSFVRVTIGTAEQNQRCVEAMREVLEELGQRNVAAAMMSGGAAK